MIEYFARPMNVRGAQQTVAEHLKETAQRARENADKFGAGQIAYIAGLLHDFGKFGVLFQEVLRKRASHIDHAMPGAILALLLKQIPRSVRIDIAVAIAAHHGGLTSGDPYTVYKYREYYAPGKQRGAHDAPCHNGRELSIPDCQ